MNAQKKSSQKSDSSELTLMVNPLSVMVAFSSWSFFFAFSLKFQGSANTIPCTSCDTIDARVIFRTHKTPQRIVKQKKRGNDKSAIHGFPKALTRAKCRIFSCCFVLAAAIWRTGNEGEFRCLSNGGVFY